MVLEPGNKVGKASSTERQVLIANKGIIKQNPQGV